jgi:catechol 2,3-dioxygenase-like lactoylglutathione lyase family enzyme
VRLYRIAVPASNLAVSRAFYEAVLGIDADATVPSRLYFHCGDVILALIDSTVEGATAMGFHPLPDNVYFATDELEAVHVRAVDAGAKITSGVELRPWGERSFYCLDPDGTPLCFVDDTTLFLGRGAEWA